MVVAYFVLWYICLLKKIFLAHGKLRWFSIKTKPSCTDGARHLLRSVHLSRYLTVEQKRTVDPVIQRNAYFAQLENLLLSMITDKSSAPTRIQNLSYSFKACSSPRTSAVRQFIQSSLPELRFDAREVYHLI